MNGRGSLAWATQAQFVGTAVIGDRRLVLSLAFVLGQWRVIAMVGSLLTDALEGMVVEDNGPKLVGAFDTPLGALQAAESYAAAWFLNQQEGERAHG